MRNRFSLQNWKCSFRSNISKAKNSNSIEKKVPNITGKKSKLWYIFYHFRNSPISKLTKITINY